MGFDATLAKAPGPPLNCHIRSTSWFRANRVYRAYRAYRDYRDYSVCRVYRVYRAYREFWCL